MDETDAAVVEHDLPGLEGRLGHRFRDATLLELAVTHASAGNARDGRKWSNERLEFLGDRVLGLCVAHLLFERHPQEEEGALARRYATLVSRETLVRVAEAVGLAEEMRLSRSEHDAGGRANPALLADACEAVIAALYLDDGLAAAERFVRTHWTPIAEEDAAPPKDPKTELQEWAQGRGLPLPRYRETDRRGPDHAPVFFVEVAVNGMDPVSASGTSKRAAERAAAETMLTRVVRQADG